MSLEGAIKNIDLFYLFLQGKMGKRNLMAWKANASGPLLENIMNQELKWVRI